MMTHSEEDLSLKPVNPVLTCRYCKLQFKTSKELRNHISSHIRVKQYFLTKRSNKPKDTATREKKFICKICSKAFIKNSLLERHIRIHSGERPFKVGKPFISFWNPNIFCLMFFSVSSVIDHSLRNHLSMYI